MPPFQTCRKGFEQDPVISGSVSSTQLCTGKTTSAYSQLPVHSQSFTITISTCGSTFAIILYAHFALFRLFELAVQMVLVGVGMWLCPVRTTRSPVFLSLIMSGLSSFFM